MSRIEKIYNSEFSHLNDTWVSQLEQNINRLTDSEVSWVLELRWRMFYFKDGKLHHFSWVSGKCQYCKPEQNLTSHELPEQHSAISLPISVSVFTQKPQLLSPSKIMYTKGIASVAQTILNILSSNKKHRAAIHSNTVPLGKRFCAIQTRNSEVPVPYF